MENVFISDLITKIQQHSKAFETINKVRGIFLSQTFGQYLENNKFKNMADGISHELLRNLETYIRAKHPASGISVHKLPYYGVNNDFSFTLVGNANYDEISRTKYLEQGNIYAAVIKPIIPSPYEESRGKTLLFRTSHGETIEGDNFIPTMVQQFMLINTPILVKAFETDISAYVKQFHKQRK